MRFFVSHEKPPGGPLPRITSRVSVFPEHLCPRMMPARCRLAQWGGAGRETSDPSLSVGRLDVRVPAAQPCPGIPLLPMLAWSPAAPRWTDSELHCTFLTTLDAVVSLVAGRAGFSLWSAWLIPCRNAMVGIRRWGEEVTFSFSPLNHLGFQAQEVRAGGDGNRGSRGLACCSLPAATSTWRLQVLERGQGGGRFSPVLPSPPPPCPYT